MVVAFLPHEPSENTMDQVIGVLGEYTHPDTASRRGKGAGSAGTHSGLIGFVSFRAGTAWE